MSERAALHLETARGLDPWVDAEAAERAEAEANAWIKGLRLLLVDGEPLRDRFQYRDDSLWWFAELYLHKRRVIARALRAIAAIDRLVAERRPSRIVLDGDDVVLAHVMRSAASRHGIAYEGPHDGMGADRRRARAKAVFHTATAVLDRLRPLTRKPTRMPSVVAAFVHAAFLRAQTNDEAYLGPILRTLDARLDAGALQLVGLGPRTNFRVRRWSDRVREFGDPLARGLPITPVEAFASWRSLQPSLEVWQRRHDTSRALSGSRELRSAAVIGGCDLWPIVESELIGIAHLQFPWSARAMDEAGAALDALEPRVIVTYAEAGGWGRALMLEARRRGIPSVGVQHGFIYRHWLNYLHEPDEMQPSRRRPLDRGFPQPTKTLLFDRVAEEHLVNQGRFPREALLVVGSPRLDDLVSRARALDDGARRALGEQVGAKPGQQVVLVAAKLSQLGTAFAALVRASGDLPDVRLVVKPHPAEDANDYVSAAGGAGHVTVAPPHADLAGLIAIARLLVTANSTAAIEAMPLGVPALVVSLPNNLSPFVAAGAMAGAPTEGDLGPALQRLLYDEMSRARFAAAREAFMARYGIGADGTAAGRSADCILSLGQGDCPPATP
jgi:hypothetical protein